MTFPIVRTTLTDANVSLAQLCNQVTGKQEIVTIQRDDDEDVALISAKELSSLQETLHLFRSPRNAERLLTALSRAENRICKPEDKKNND